MSQNLSHFHKKRRAFTLVEIMAATAVMSVVMLVVLSLVSFVLNAWNRSTASLESSGRAQFALDLLEKELSSLEFRQSAQNYEFLRAITSTVNASGISMPNQQSTWLIFLATPADSSSGAVQCISYKVVYQNPLRQNGGGDAQMFGLYRSKMSPKATLMNAYVNKASFADQGLEGVMKGELTAQDDSPDEIAQSATEGVDNLLVPNLMSLRIIPYFWDEGGNTPVLTPFQGGLTNPLQITNTLALDAKNGAGLISGGRTNVKLAYIDIIMTLLTSEGSSFLHAMQQGRAQTPADWDEWLNKNTYMFSRRVAIQGQ